MPVAVIETFGPVLLVLALSIYQCRNEEFLIGFVSAGAFTICFWRSNKLVCKIFFIILFGSWLGMMDGLSNSFYSGVRMEIFIGLILMMVFGLVILILKKPTLAKIAEIKNELGIE